jgi:membrane associated rhomboid family serine protease
MFYTNTRSLVKQASDAGVPRPPGLARRQGHIDTHMATLTPVTEAPKMFCYRHPDRETGVTCSECGRPICPDCMVFAPVGIRCPDHAGQAQGAAKVSRGVRRASFEGRGAVVTKALVAMNVGIYLLELGLGGGVNGTGNQIYEKGVLAAPLVDRGDWWRLITAAFLHYGPIHLAFNMLALWWFGSAVEQVLGRGRYLLLYLVSGLAGSAGALLASPNALTVGASGAIFGILGAAIVLERQQTYVLGGSALTLLIVNIAFTFAVPGTSIGGHLGGLAGGALCILALSRFGKGSVAYSRIDAASVVSLVVIGLLSVAVAYWKVRGYA